MNLACAEAKGVPLIIGEMGSNRYCFEKEKGGGRWYEDMFSLLDERRMGFMLWCYHGDWWGLYQSKDAIKPEETNRELVTLLMERKADRIR